MVLAILKEQFAKLPQGQQDAMRLLLWAIETRVKSAGDPRISRNTRVRLTSLRNFSPGNLFDIIQHASQVSDSFKLLGLSSYGRKDTIFLVVNSQQFTHSQQQIIGRGSRKLSFRAPRNGSGCSEARSEAFGDECARRDAEVAGSEVGARGTEMMPRLILQTCLQVFGEAGLSRGSGIKRPVNAGFCFVL